ncbi:shikimate kinase [Arthrobacter sp. MYb227]|uniref:shikimate kinase n=1 Tax=Arthrobacter sp. MYb227 TaxID=1848601 RepID=UPI000CFB48A7|nr:shikimate kinase [Arthrobacter sp. MYb227]PQZ93808.1 shikimate kinase [Arthrobacter sp. MYb227]
MSRTIFLIGPMASGKSAVGAQLARQLGTTMIDTDELVVQEHGTIKEIFAAGGEPAFRAFESEALRQAAAAGDSREATPPLVIASGGGAVLAPHNRELLATGFTVYLYIDAQTVAKRIAGDVVRPLLAGAPDDTTQEPSPLETWQNIFTTRTHIYEGCADLTLDVRTQNPAEIAEAIITAYRDAGH